MTIAFWLGGGIAIGIGLTLLGRCLLAAARELSPALHALADKLPGATPRPAANRAVRTMRAEPVSAPETTPTERVTPMAAPDTQFVPLRGRIGGVQ